MARKAGGWTVEVEPAPGQLSLRKPCGGRMTRVRDVGFFGICAALTWGLAANTELVWTHGGGGERLSVVVGWLLAGGGTLFYGAGALRQFLNRYQLETREDALVFRTGPFPRWKSSSLRWEWITAVEVDWTTDEYEHSGLEFTLQNGQTETWPFPDTRYDDLEIAARLVRKALTPAPSDGPAAKGS